MRRLAIALLLALLLPTLSAQANIIKVSTAAGINIRVAADFAPKIQAVISDLVSRGIKIKQIHCFARSGHIHNSLHYTGHACDFDFYRGCMGCSARWTRHVGDIIARHDLRDGCSFRDCGHIDAGRSYAQHHTKTLSAKGKKHGDRSTRHAASVPTQPYTFPPL